MNKFLGSHKWPKLTQDEIENLNRPTTRKKTELVIKKFDTHTHSASPDDFTGEFYRTFEEKMNEFPHKQIQFPHKLFQKMEEEGTLSNSFFEASILIPKPKILQENHTPISLIKVYAKILNIILENWTQ